MALNTNTARPPRNHFESQTVESEPSVLDRLTLLVNHVARSEEYRTLRAHHIPHTEAYIEAVDTILTSPDNGFNGIDSALLRTSSRVGGLIDAKVELVKLDDRRSEDGRFSKEDSARAFELKLNYSIPFNQELKALINEAPDLQIDELAAGLAKTYVAVFGRYNTINGGDVKDAADIIKTDEVVYRLKQSINGMRHEIAAETMLISLGIECDFHISAEQDAQGIDMIAIIDGKREPIDIKASVTGEERSRSKNPGSRAVWTGLDRDDFTGRRSQTPRAVSIPYATAEEHAEAFLERIRSVIERSNNRKRTVAHKLGRSAQNEIIST